MSDVQFDEGLSQYSRGMRGAGSSSGKGGAILAFMMKIGHFKNERQANIALLVLAMVFIAGTVAVSMVFLSSPKPHRVTEEEREEIIEKRISGDAPREIQERRRKQLERLIPVQ